MPENPGLQATSLVTVAILVDGSEIPSHYGVILVEVSASLNAIPTATIHIDDGSVTAETFPISESDTFLPGKKIKIKLGYDTQEDDVFEGLIVSQGLRVRSEERSALVVKCMSEAAKMTIARKNAIFQKQKDSDIIGKVLGEYGSIKGKVDATNYKHKEVVQYQSSDWDFVMSRAELNGLLVHVDAKGKVNVVAPKTTGPELLVTYGADILSSNLDLDAVDQLPEVTCSAWDMSTNKVAEGKSSEPSLNSQGNLTGKKLADVLGKGAYELHTTVPAEPAVLKSWASARLLRSRLARIQGQLSFYGNSKAVPNSVIEINGLGSRFNGDGYISAVNHRVEEGTWSTEVTLGLPAEWFVETKANIQVPPAAGLLPGIGGLCTAVVKKIDADPDGEFRVQITLPLVDQEDKGVWARLIQSYASKEIGAFFYPEVGDEVIVGFLQDDPRFPVILGSVYSKSKHPAPFTPDDKNTNKGWVTKEKMQILFDDVKKDILIETPVGKRILISEDKGTIVIEDDHKNKVELASAGITLDTAGDIVLKAKGNISMDAKAKIEMKAAADLMGEGLNTKFKGKVGFAAEGAAQAELKASGQVTVKGAMVMIN